MLLSRRDREQNIFDPDTNSLRVAIWFLIPLRLVDFFVLAANNSLTILSWTLRRSQFFDLRSELKFSSTNLLFTHRRCHWANLGRRIKNIFVATGSTSRRVNNIIIQYHICTISTCRRYLITLVYMSSFYTKNSAEHIYIYIYVNAKWFS